MNGTWNLRLFLSISLGLHFFAFSLLSLLLPDFKINQLQPLNIEVSLLPVNREEGGGAQNKNKDPIKIVERREESPKTESTVKTPEEKMISQVENVEVTLPQKEREPVSTLPVQSEVRVVSVNETQSYPTASEKREVESKKEGKVVIASLGNPIPPKSSSETSQVAMKNPSHSENEIAFAQPRYSKNPKPVYPQEAREKGYEGEVLLKVEVLSNGRVGEIELKRSSGHEVLDRSAMTTVKQWKFVPAKKGEAPVSFWVNIPVTFQLR